MRTDLPRRTAALALAVALLVVFLAAAPPNAAMAQDVSAADTSASSADAPLREQTVYIPYEDLRRVFEREGRPVFLPYEEFIDLWRKARRGDVAPPDDKPPVAYLVSQAEHTARVAPDSEVVSVESRMDIEILAKGWHEIPLALSGAAVTRATLDGEPARLVFDAQRGYVLLVENKDDQPQTYALELAYAKAYAKAPGQNSVSFAAPRAPVSRWEINIPDPGVKVTVDPMIAATEAPGDDDAPAADPPADATRVLAFVGAAPQVRIGWTPRAEGAMGLEALGTVEAVHHMTVDQGMTRTRTVLTYAISRNELQGLVLRVPSDQKVVNVFDPNVRKWSVAEAGADAPEMNAITVELFEPATASQRLVVELEKYDAPAAAGEAAAPPERAVALPVVEARGVVRQQGVVLVDVVEGLRAEVTDRAGLAQVDATELPQPYRGRPHAFSFRYAALPAALSLEVEPIQPRLTARTLVSARLEPQELTVDLMTVFTIERSGVFRLELAVPEPYEVRRVEGAALVGGAAVDVESHHREGERLIVDLKRKAIGPAGLRVRLSRRLDEADLLSPTGNEVDVPLPLPRVATETVEREDGRLVVFAPETLRISARTEGLRTVDVAEAVRFMGSPLAAPGLRPIMAYAFADAAAQATLVAERRAPQVTVQQLLAARVEAGLVDATARFFYDIRYGAVKSLRIDVPQELAESGRLRNTTSGVREETISPPPDDLDPGYVAWRLSGEKEFTGSETITLQWQTPIESLDVGTSVDIELPALKPRDGRAWGQIVLSKAENIDLQPVSASAALREIDPQHDVRRGAGGGAWAAEFHADWALTVRATRYEHEAVKLTSIDRALLRAVVTRGGEMNVQALFRMRSAQQRLEVELPENVELRDRYLRIGGKTVALEKGTDAAGRAVRFIPLVGQEADRPFLLELRYTVTDVDLAAAAIDMPRFPGQAGSTATPALQNVYASVYLPEDRTWLGAEGPWADRNVWYRRIVHSWPVPTMTEDRLTAWVTENAAGAAVAGDDAFQTHGSRYLFSAVRPGGALVVRSVRSAVFKGAVLAIIVIGGLLLLPARASRRALAVGAAIIAVIVLAIFLPTVARQVVSREAAGSAAVVLVIWVLWYLIVTRPRRPKTDRGQPPSPVPPQPPRPTPVHVAAEPAPEPKPEAPPPPPPADSQTPQADAPPEPPADQPPADQPRADDDADPPIAIPDDPTKGGPTHA